MNSLQIAESTTVVAVVKDPGPACSVVLRCFDCDWGMTLGDWVVALQVGSEHEREHGKGYAPPPGKPHQRAAS